MARYLAARRLMDVVIPLDPANQTSLSLRNRIEEGFSELLRHRAGESHHHSQKGNGSGNGDLTDHQKAGSDTAYNQALKLPPANGGNGTHGNGGVKGTHGLEVHGGALMVVVDQDEQLLSQLAATLPRFGYWFAGAASFEEAIELLSLISPDIVVSEVNFGSGAKGCDLFSWMRTNPALAETPFMFQATRLATDVLLAGKRFGVDDFLLKPVDGAVLAASAAHVLHRRRSASVAV